MGTPEDFSHDEVLSRGERDQLARLIQRRGVRAVMSDLGVVQQTLLRSILGLPCRRATVAIIKIRLREGGQ